MESWLMISSGIILANFYGDDQLLYQTVSDCNYQIHLGFQRSQASRPTDAVCALRAPPARSGFDKALAQPSAESTGAPAAPALWSSSCKAFPAAAVDPAWCTRAFLGEEMILEKAPKKIDGKGESYNVRPPLDS